MARPSSVNAFVLDSTAHDGGSWAPRRCTFLETVSNVTALQDALSVYQVEKGDQIHPLRPYCTPIMFLGF